jgi:hypothetical protein
MLAALWTTSILNGVVSLFVFFSRALNRSQKLAQALLVWLVPLLGALAVVLFMLADRDTRRPRTNTLGALDIDHPAIQLSNADDLRI